MPKKDILRQNSLGFLTLIGFEGTFQSLPDRLVDSFEGLFAFSLSKPPFANFFPKCSDYILRSLHLYTFLFWPPSHYGQKVPNFVQKLWDIFSFKISETWISVPINAIYWLKMLKTGASQEYRASKKKLSTGCLTLKCAIVNGSEG